MKKHWVEFTVVVYGSVLVEGDDTPQAAADYVKKALDVRCHVENEDAEVNQTEVHIDYAYEETKPDQAEGGE